MLLAGDKVYLRRLRPDDLDFLYRWENDPEVWRWGDCGEYDSSCRRSAAERFSRDELRKFIENQQHDIDATEQLRFMICRNSPPCEGGVAVGTTDGVVASADSPVGMIDLFDYDPVNRCAGVGIIVCNEADRRRGYASEALELVAGYAERELGLRRIWCVVEAGNLPSIALFRKHGFVESKIDVSAEKNDKNGVCPDKIAFQRLFFA